MRDDERKLLITEMLKGDFQGKHLEIGTAAGGTLWQLVKAYPENKKPPFVVVDPLSYFPNQEDIVKRNLRQNGVDPLCVEFRKQRSADAFKDAESHGETFDWILVDGAHKMPYVMQDLRWSRLLNEGGLICFHDYSPALPGVQRAVDRFMKKYPYYEKVGQAETLLVLRKTKPSPSPEVTASDIAISRVVGFGQQITASLRKRIKR